MRDQRDAGRQQLGPRRLDLDRRTAVTRELQLVVRAGLLAILELGLGNRGPEVDVPQRRRFELVGAVLAQQVQERQLRHALRGPADGGVGHRPVDREPELPPQRLERLLVLDGQALAQRDEVRPRHGDRLLARLVGRLEGGVVRQGRIAADAVIVLDPAFRRQAVVVPPHRVEHGLAAHALVARDDVGVGVGKDVPDVQRSAHRRRRGVDGIDPVARARAIEAVNPLRFPTRAPLGFEALEGRLLGHATTVGGRCRVGHKLAIVLIRARFLNAARRFRHAGRGVSSVSSLRDSAWFAGRQ